MFSKYDEKFAEMAANPTLRRAAITDLSGRRTMIFWCAMFMTLLITVCLIISTFESKPVGVGLGFVAALQWIIFFKFDSDLRLLAVIDRLHREEKTMT